MEQAKALWSRTCDLIRAEVSEISYNTFIDVLSPLAVSANALILQAPSDMIQSTIEKYYLSTIRSCAAQAGEGIEAVTIVQPADRSLYVREDSGEYSPCNLFAKYTFNTFVVGGSNYFAHAAALAVAKSPAKAYNPLFIYGGVGLGKTHLMHAIGHYVRENNARARVMYVSSETFTNEMIQSISSNRNKEFRNRYRNADVLMVDDIQFIARKEGVQEEFFHTFNALHTANKQIIISSDKPPREIAQLEERLRSRFEWGLIADIQPPDLETRIAILKRRAEEEKIHVPDSVLEYIAERVQSNIRELEGLLTRVIAYAQFNRVSLDTHVAATALKDMLPNGAPRVLTPALIQETVAAYYNLSVDSFCAKRRDQEVAFPRQVAMYLSRCMTDWSLPKIGEAFGGRNHTTVMHAHEKITEQLKADPALAATVADLKKRLITN